MPLPFFLLCFVAMRRWRWWPLKNRLGQNTTMFMFDIKPNWCNTHGNFIIQHWSHSFYSFNWHRVCVCVFVLCVYGEHPQCLTRFLWAHYSHNLLYVCLFSINYSASYILMFRLFHNNCDEQTIWRLTGKKMCSCDLDVNTIEHWTVYLVQGKSFLTTKIRTKYKWSFEKGLFCYFQASNERILVGSLCNNNSIVALDQQNHQQARISHSLHIIKHKYIDIKYHAAVWCVINQLSQLQCEIVHIRCIRIRRLCAFHHAGKLHYSWFIDSNAFAIQLIYNEMIIK